MSLLSILPNINLVGNPGISLGKKGEPTRGGCALTVGTSEAQSDFGESG